MLIEFRSKGNFENTNRFLKKLQELNLERILSKYGQEGVNALREATPIDTGKTAASWAYRIDKNAGYISLVWYNTNVNKGVNIAVILQYGHGTGTGGWVEGIDYINPALRPLFDKIASDAWEEIIKR